MCWPYLPAPVVLCRLAQDPSFGAVLVIHFTSGGYVMYGGLSIPMGTKGTALCVVVGIGLHMLDAGDLLVQFEE